MENTLKELQDIKSVCYYDGHTTSNYWGDGHLRNRQLSALTKVEKVIVDVTQLSTKLNSMQEMIFSQVSQIGTLQNQLKEYEKNQTLYANEIAMLKGKLQVLETLVSMQ